MAVSQLNLNLVLTGALVASAVGSSGIVVFPTVAALRLAVNPDNTKLYQTLGYYNINDGGDSRYYWDPTDIASSDDGGSVLTVTGVASGRMKLIASTQVNVKQFGAVGDGVTNCLGAFRLANTFLASGGMIFVPTGTFTIIQSGFASGTLASYIIPLRTGTKIIGLGGSTINIATTKIPTFICSHTSGNVFYNLDFLWSGNRYDEGSPDDLSPNWNFLTNLCPALGVVVSGWVNGWNGNTSWPAILGFGCDYLTIDRCSFTSANLTSGSVMPVWIHVMGKAASGNYGYNNRITNCRFNGYLWGIHASNQDGFVLSDIYCTNNDQHPTPNGHYGEFLYFSTPSDTGYSRWSQNCVIRNIVDTGLSLAQHTGLHATLKFRLLQDSVIQNISSQNACGTFDLIGVRRCHFSNIYSNLQRATTTNYADEGAIRFYQPQENSWDGLAANMYSESNVFDGFTIHGPNTQPYSCFRLFQSDTNQRFNVYTNWTVYLNDANTSNYAGLIDSSFSGTFIVSGAAGDTEFSLIQVPQHSARSYFECRYHGTSVGRAHIAAVSGCVNNLIRLDPWVGGLGGPRVHSAMAGLTPYGSRAALEPLFGANPQSTYTDGATGARTGTFQLPYQGVWLLSCTATQNASPSAKATQQFQAAWLDSKATIQSLGSLMALTTSTDISSITGAISSGGVVTFTINQATGQTSNTVDVGYLWTSQLWSASP